jgi:hypothetical protein
MCLGGSSSGSVSSLSLPFRVSFEEIAAAERVRDERRVGCNFEFRVMMKNRDEIGQIRVNSERRGGWMIQVEKELEKSV